MTGPTPLVIVCGWNVTATGGVAHSLLHSAEGPGSVVVHHDLTGLSDGIIVESVRWPSGRGPDVERSIRLEHGCVSCTLRESVLPLLRALAQRPDVARIVLQLDSRLEPEAFSCELQCIVVPGLDGQPDAVVADDVAIAAVVTVLDRAAWWQDATGVDTLAERGRSGADTDDRTVAQVVLGHTEFADILVVVGRTSGEWCGTQLAAALARLIPLAAVTAPAGLDDALRALPSTARRGRPGDVHGPLLRGQPPLDNECDVALVEFTAQRPFHPQRLHEAVDVLLSGVLRTRGRFWVATQPHAVMWLESAGRGLRVDLAGQWLATLDPDDAAWSDVPLERRAMAGLRWHPRFGDRQNEIVALVYDADPDLIRSELHAALLTDAELDAGEDSWRAFADPFGARHRDPCADADTPAIVAAPGRQEGHREA